MSQGKKEEPDARKVYGDIIDLPHHQSAVHPHMSLYDRAAQFSSFKALTGYEDMISEEARPVDSKIELSEEEMDELNQTLSQLNDILETGRRPIASITYFIPDLLKAGGRYETVTEPIRRIDATRGKIILVRTEGYGRNHVEISIPDLLDIREVSS